MLVALALFACNSSNGTVADATDGSLTESPTPDTDTDVIVDTDTDTGTAPIGELELTDLDWRLHAIQSVVYVSWTQSQAADLHVEYSFDDGVWLSTPTVSYEAGDNERVVVGIPYETEAEWRLVADSASVDGSAIETGALPAGLPLGEVVVSEPGLWLSTGNYLLTSINEDNGGWTGGDYWTFIIDRQARVVWAHKAPNHAWTLFAQVSTTGDYFMWDEQRYWSEFGSRGEDSQVHKTWLDEEFEVVDTPGLHHAFVQLPDETLVYGSRAHGGEEALVEKAPLQPDETVLWTCDDDWPGAGGCESNGIFYQESTDSFLYSFYTNSSVVEVDHVTGESLWWAGEVNGGYDFDPRQSQFAWQHGISYTSTGSLLLSSEWDGGGGGPTETWLMEYEVDDTNGELHLLWADNSETRADTNGQAWRLDNGNTLHIVGSASELREVAPNGLQGDDVWRVDFHGTRLLGQGQFIEDLYTLVKP